MIPNEVISEIIETARIEDVVGDFVTLKKRGANLLGLCPFHDEKTPSFTVSPAKGIYKCFGCGKAGNSVRFIMDHEQYSYPEALRYLAGKYHIEVSEEKQSPEQMAIADERESLFIVTQFASGYFQEALLNSEEGKAIGYSYFRERSFTEEIIRKFQLGYSPEGWEVFTAAALKAGYKEEFLEKAGLTIVKEDGKKFDRFRGRVMFPIHNISGRVIGFGGRTLKSDKKVAKYVNSPESDIYQKSKVLYGLYFAKKDIIQQDNCYLVEGYTDVISMFQAGIENVVASSGTSLTEGQISLIKRYTQNITILYDGDEAGIKASFRGMEMILGAGMNVKIVLFPDGEDPDSYAKKLSAEELKSFLDNNAQDFIRFKTSLLSQQAKNDPVKKADLVRETLQTIALIPDAITRSVYVKECSVLIDVDEKILIQELNRIRRKNFSKQNGAPEPAFEIPEPEQKAPKQLDQLSPINWKAQENDILRILLKHGKETIQVEVENEEGEKEKIPVRLDEFIIHELQHDHITFENEMQSRIFQEYVRILNEEKEPDEQFFIRHEDEALSAAVIDIISSRYHLDNWEGKNIFTTLEEDHLLRSAEKYLYYYKLSKIKDMISRNQQQLKKQLPEEEQAALLKQQAGLINAKKELASRLGNVTI